MIGRKHLHPLGNIEPDLTYRKLIENLLQNPRDILFAELLAAYRHYRNPVFIPDFLRQTLCLILMGKL